MTALNLSTALVAFVKADGKLATSALAYIRLAIANVYSAPIASDASQSLIEDICDATGSRGKVTTDFPKGKANPNALKANGFSGLAEASRLIAKVGTKLDVEAVRDVVEAFLGVINNVDQYRTLRNADKRVRDAIAKGDAKAIRSALRKAKADYIANVYPERPLTFNALRSALDKATASKKSQDVAPVEATDETTDETTVSDAATLVVASDALANASADDLIAALVGKLGDASDDAFDKLVAAIRDAANVAATVEAIAA